MAINKLDPNQIEAVILASEWDKYLNQKEIHETSGSLSAPAPNGKKQSRTT